MPQLFDPVDPAVDFPALEADVLRFWRERDVFRRSVEQRPADNLFVFYEGPPTANGRPGVHHVMPRVLKDLFARYKSMRGYRVPRKAGWDTHGLPVEIEVEKELGLRSKPDIETYGIAAFNAKCRESVGRHVRDFEELTERIAFWADMDDPYVTYHDDYIESCWWIFKRLWERDYLFKSYRVAPHCPRCETSLSDHELSQGYREDVPDPSVFVKFRLTAEARAILKSSLTSEACAILDLDDERPVSIVAWTTTPWTLPGNTALAVKGDADYGLYEHEGELLVVAEALAEAVLGEGVKTPETFTGEKLHRLVYDVRLAYEPLYRPEAVGLPVWRFHPWGLRLLSSADEAERLRRIITADHVSLDDGTGIVHIAPAFGGEDFADGVRTLLLFARTVNERGEMAAGLPGAGAFAKDADAEIIRDLDERGLLLRAEEVRHTYPFCWRCESPLLYYAKPSWYIRTTREREGLLAGNARVNWQPAHIQRGRFGNWLEQNIDWAVSRERYWGTPLPFWECVHCHRITVVGSRAELAERAVDRAAAEALDDLHRPFIDAIALRCDAEGCGGEMRRVPEVADAWFDSGAMPYAQWHYPFEHGDEFRRQFPADFICEAIDQTRGWFYTLHAEASLLGAAGAVPETIAYRNVVCHGHILDERGDKMSKSRGNVVEPFDLLDELGADAVRWYIYASAPVGASRRFSARLVNEGLRRFQLTLWNVYRFLVGYANADGIDPRQRPDGAPPPLDRWLLSELNALIARVTEALDRYDPTAAARAIEAFADDLSNWYVRRSRRRFWRGRSGDDADKRHAYFTLHATLVALARLLAPFTPFLAEELWRNLARSLDGGAPESVHLADWPDPVPLESGGAVFVDEALNAETQLVKRIASLGRAARAKAGLRVRQPLAGVLVRPRAPADAEALARNEALLLDELNVKALTLLEDESAVAEFAVKPNLPALGPRLGRELGAVRDALAGMDAGELAAAVRAGRSVTVAGHELAPADLLVETRGREGYAAASEGGQTVAVATALTPALVDEGRVREIVRRLQDLRREAGLDLADRITAWCAGGEAVARALAAHGAYVREETLATELVAEAPPDDAARAEFTLDGETVVAGVRRAGP